MEKKFEIFFKVYTKISGQSVQPLGGYTQHTSCLDEHKYQISFNFRIHLLFLFYKILWNKETLTVLLNSIKTLHFKSHCLFHAHKIDYSFYEILEDFEVNLIEGKNIKFVELIYFLQWEPDNCGMNLFFVIFLDVFLIVATVEYLNI